MESIRITETETGLHVEDFPDALKIIGLEGPKAKRLAHLSLHISDLQFAGECLESINSLPDEPYTIRQALWRCAIVHYAKCFGSSESRFQLDAKKIYAKFQNAMSNFNYFFDLRNKHFVHDENSYTQGIPGAIVNRADGTQKIAKVVCLNVIAETLDQNNYGNLHSLIQHARTWAVAELDALCDIVSKELEQLPHDELVRRPSIKFTAPMLAEAAKPRNAP